VVREQIANACKAVGRDIETVTLIAVTKGFPADDIRILADLGVTDVGESRSAEGQAKRTEVSEYALTWHCIGQVQTNKAAHVARWADMIHGVDRPGLVVALERAAGAQSRSLDVLAQVDVLPGHSPRSDGSSRGGCPVADLASLADSVAESSMLRLRGVMTVADPTLDPAWVFGELAQVSADLRLRYPTADVVSAGMSGDFRQALAAGATHLRIGSAILGERA